MPGGLRRLLYSSIDYQLHSGDAVGEAGGGALYSVEYGQSVFAFWGSTATSYLCEFAAWFGDVRGDEWGCDGLLD
jgi:hypothetical protein